MNNNYDVYNSEEINQQKLLARLARQFNVDLKKFQKSLDYVLSRIDIDEDGNFPKTTFKYQKINPETQEHSKAYKTTNIINAALWLAMNSPSGLPDDHMYDPKFMIPDKIEAKKKGFWRKAADNFMETVANPVAEFINDEIFMNKDNVRVKIYDEEIMKMFREGGDIAAAFIASPFAAYMAASAAPYVLSTLKIAGQALTPSTWLEGVASSLGYQLPSWLGIGADLALSAKFAYDAGKEFDENGLTWSSAFNILASIIPMVKDQEGVEAVSSALNNIFRNTNKLSKEATTFMKNRKVAKAMNKALSDIQKMEEPHFQVPENKNIGSNVSFSNDAVVIPRNNNNTSTTGFSTSSQQTNTSGFGSSFPQINTPNWDILKGTVRNLNYDNVKNPDRAFFTLPGFGRYRIEKSIDNGVVSFKLFQNGNHVNSFDDLDSLKKSIDTTISGVYDEKTNPFLTKSYKLSKDPTWFTLPDVMVNSSARNPGLQDTFRKNFSIVTNDIKKSINNVYKTDAYKQRFLGEGFTEQEYNDYIAELEQLSDEIIPIIYNSEINNRGTSSLRSALDSNGNMYTTGNYVGFNANTDALTEYQYPYTIFHEFGHAQNGTARTAQTVTGMTNSGLVLSTPNKQYKYPMIKKVYDHNEELLKDIKSQIDPNNSYPKPHVDYVTDTEESTQRLRELMKYQIENNASVEEALKSDIGGKTELPSIVNNEYLKRMLPHILTMGPVILGAAYGASQNDN